MDLKTILLAGAIALPVQQADNWQLLEYSKLPPNQVSFASDGMRIEVKQSASPIIYPLAEPRRVSRIRVSGSLSNLLDLEPGTQGEENADDFSLKIGLVVSGDKTLGGFQRMFSPKWIKTLFDLAPEGAGVDRIYFLNAVQFESLLGQQRQHPLSDLIYENNAWLLDKTGDFEFSHTLEQPQEVVALWLSIDGDDSKSSYTTIIRNLSLED